MAESPKVAIVTGASRGIGAGLVAALRRADYSVVGTARAMGSSADSGFLPLAGDITEPDTAQRVVGRALDRFGRIDSLINNAGTYIGKSFTDYTLEDYAAITSVNLAGFFHITQRVIRQMEWARSMMLSTGSSGAGAFVTGEILHIDGGQAAVD